MIISSRNFDYLKESNAIEGITEINYRKPDYQIKDRGHFGAYTISQNMALHKDPLTLKTIKKWQKLITEEQRLFGHEIDEEAIGRTRNPQTLRRNLRIGQHIPPHFEDVPTLLENLIEKINENLKKCNFSDDADYCKLLGSSLQNFEAIHPFADGNGRTGRLLANYIATYCRRPIIVFKSEKRECNRFYEAHKSKKAMSIFMSDKIKEAVFGLNGSLMVPSGVASGSTLEYQNSNGYKESIHWHELDAAVKRWQLA